MFARFRSVFFLRVAATFVGVSSAILPSAAFSQLFDKVGEAIPGTQTLMLEPGARLSDLDLTNLYVPLRDPNFGPSSQSLP